MRTFRWALCTVAAAVALWPAAGGAQAVDPDVANFNGVAAYRAGDLFAAIGHFQAALAGNPQNKGAAFNLATALAETGDYVEAERALRRLEALDPAYKGLNFEIGNCLARLGRFDDAARYLARAVSEDPAYPGSNYMLGYVYVGAGKYAEALGPLAAALSAPALQGPANYYLSMAHEKLGDKDKALAYLRAAAKAPDSPEGKRAADVVQQIDQSSAAAESGKSGLAWGMFIQTGAAFDSNVPSLPDFSQAQIPGFSAAPGASTHWGSRFELYLNGNVDYPFARGQSIGALAGWYMGYHFLPVESIVSRAEFDANTFDLMLYHLNVAYRYQHRAGNTRVVPALELGWLDSFTDAFGGVVHGNDPSAGPNHLISDFDVVPSVAVSFHRRESTRLFYRLRVETFYPGVANPSVDGRSAIGNQVGFEQNVLFFAKDTFTLRFAYENSAADGTQWSWGGITLGAGLSVNVFDVVELKGGGELETRGFGDSAYVMTDNSGVKSRSDKRLSAYAGPDFLIGSRVRLEIKYLVVKNFSNIEERFDYIRHVGMLKVDVSI